MKPQKFLFISSSDLYGGGSIVSYNLHKSLVQNGYLSMMVVNNKKSDDDSVIELQGHIKKFIKDCLLGYINFPFSYSLAKLLNEVYERFYKIIKKRGREIFFYPASHKILTLINYKPDVIFLSNIHSNFFDIRLIAKWSKEFHIFYSLSDLWLFTGHCGIPLDCEKFFIGCGDCPDLTLSPSIPKDKTLENHFFKKKIIINNRLHFIAPSKWVYNISKQIKLNPDSSLSLIPNAIDTKKFSPYDQFISRKKIGLSKNDFVILTSAIGFINNPYKDLNTMIKAYKRLKSRIKDKNIILIVIGENNNNYNLINNDEIIFTGIINDQRKIINYYRSADILVHSSNIETWGYTVSEALSIGIPVIASNVGGILDQIKGLKNITDENLRKLNQYDISEANGILFNRANVDELYLSLLYLINNNKIYKQLKINSRKYAVENLDSSKYLNSFLNICRERFNHSR